MTADRPDANHRSAMLSPCDLKAIRYAVSELRAANPDSVLADLVDEKLRAIEDGDAKTHHAASPAAWRMFG